MDIGKKVRLLMAAYNLNASTMAEMAGISQSNFSKKMKNNSFSIEDLEKITGSVGAQVEVSIVLKDGTQF